MYEQKSSRLLWYSDSRLSCALSRVCIPSSQTGVSSVVCVVIGFLFRSCCQANAGFPGCNFTFRSQIISSSPQIPSPLVFFRGTGQDPGFSISSEIC